MFSPIRNQNGIALVTIVLVLLMLTVLGYAGLSNSLIGFKTADNDKFATGALQNADAGIADAARQLVNGTIADAGYPPGNANWSYTSSTTGFNNSYTVSYLLANGGIVLDPNGAPYYKIDSTGYFPATGNGIQRKIRGLIQLNQKKSPFGWAVFAKQSVSLGASAIIDSYNASTDPNITTALGHGKVGTNGTSSGAVTLSGIQVNGDVVVGPGGNPSTAISLQNGSTVSGTKQAATSAQDMTPPTDPGGGTSRSAITSSTTLSAGNYSLPSITLTNGSLTINGNVTLHVSGNIALNGSCTVNIASGGSLTIYESGNFSVGTGSLNWGGLPKNFVVYGTSTCTSITLGVSTINAAIYAPNANVTSSCSWFNGSLIANKITGSGSFRFYYDESLKNLGTGITGFTLASWREI